MLFQLIQCIIFAFDFVLLVAYPSPFPLGLQMNIVIHPLSGRLVVIIVPSLDVHHTSMITQRHSTYSLRRHLGRDNSSLTARRRKPFLHALLSLYLIQSYEQ